MPTARALVRRNRYIDSITLLQINAAVTTLGGVLDAALVMATDLNRRVLLEAGLLVDDAASAGPNDLVVAVRAESAAGAEHALREAEVLLGRRKPGDGSEPRLESRSLRAAHRNRPDARVAVISVPGAYAAAEAHLALSQGLNVFLFSDNVALADEVELKRRADGRGLLIMGPDCGTSILNGIGFGFANRVRRGSIGIVGASGTGIQEVASLIHQWGGGVSHAIGTGGRDMCTAVGGTTTRHAIALLRDDPATQTLVVLSKSSDEDVERGVLALLASSGKRAIACVLDSRTQLKAVERASSLEEAARLALGKARSEDVLPAPELRLADGQRQIRGLFCGGTLCHEATVAVGDWADHRFVDFGEDQYTRGRAHPMIDPTLRNHAIVQAGRDPNVAVILLDVVLGLAAHPDPAGAAAPAIGEARAAAEGVGRDLAVIAHVVGTDEDPQVIARQEAKLRAAGVRVAPSNFAAATLAARLVARAGA